MEGEIKDQDIRDHEVNIGAPVFQELFGMTIEGPRQFWNQLGWILGMEAESMRFGDLLASVQEWLMTSELEIILDVARQFREDMRETEQENMVGEKRTRTPGDGIDTPNGDPMEEEEIPLEKPRPSKSQKRNMSPMEIPWNEEIDQWRTNVRRSLEENPREQFVKRTQAETMEPGNPREIPRLPDLNLEPDTPDEPKRLPDLNVVPETREFRENSIDPEEMPASITKTIFEGLSLSPNAEKLKIPEMMRPILPHLRAGWYKGEIMKKKEWEQLVKRYRSYEGMPEREFTPKMRVADKINLTKKEIWVESKIRKFQDCFGDLISGPLMKIFVDACMRAKTTEEAVLIRDCVRCLVSLDTIMTQWRQQIVTSTNVGRTAASEIIRAQEDEIQLIDEDIQKKIKENAKMMSASRTLRMTSAGVKGRNKQPFRMSPSGRRGPSSSSASGASFQSPARGSFGRGTRYQGSGSFPQKPTSQYPQRGRGRGYPPK